jgi:hypothetical protein
VNANGALVESGGEYTELVLKRDDDKQYVQLRPEAGDADGQYETHVRQKLRGLVAAAVPIDGASDAGDAMRAADSETLLSARASEIDVSAAPAPITEMSVVSDGADELRAFY